MWLGVFIFLSLMGCGNKGDLYLPDETEPVKSEQSQSDELKSEPVDK